MLWYVRCSNSANQSHVLFKLHTLTQYVMLYSITYSAVPKYGLALPQDTIRTSACSVTPATLVTLPEGLQSLQVSILLG